MKLYETNGRGVMKSYETSGRGITKCAFGGIGTGCVLGIIGCRSTR